MSSFSEKESSWLSLWLCSSQAVAGAALALGGIRSKTVVSLRQAAPRSVLECGYMVTAGSGPSRRTAPFSRKASLLIISLQSVCRFHRAAEMVTRM